MTAHSDFLRPAHRPLFWLAALFAIILVAPPVPAEDAMSAPISIDLRDCEIGAAIRTLMQASGANIIVDGEISGSVTCQLRDKTLEEVLDLLTQAKGLHWHKKTDVYVITRQPIASPAAAPVAAADTPPAPPAAPEVSGPIDLNPRSVEAAAPRPKTSLQSIPLRHLDPYAAADLLEKGTMTSSIDLMASMMRESGVPTTGIPQFFQNNTATPAGGNDLYGRLNSGGFSARPAFPNGVAGGGFAQFPGGPGVDPGAGGGVAGAAGGAAGGGGSALLPPGIEDIVPYDLTNSLLVRGTDEAIAELRDIITRYLDVAPRQVRIEAEFLTVNMNDEALFGFNWSITDGQTTIDAPLAVGGDLNVRYATGNFSLALQALKKADRGRTIIAPRVTAVNQRPAVIASQQALWYTNTETIVNPFGGATLTNKTPVQIPVTIQLMVFPRINGDDTITMFLMPVVQDVMGYSEGPNGEQLPIIQSQYISVPEIRVRDGETLAMGGLVRRTDSKTSRKLPFFSDLPLIGNLFRTRQDREQDMELLIFVTPKILPNEDGPSSLPGAGAVAPTPVGLQ